MIPISDKLAGMLNAQIARERGNNQLYIHFSSWAHTYGLKGIASFFSGEAEGELGHAKIISDLLNDSNVQIAIPDIPAKPSSFSGCEEILRLYVEAEAETTDRLEEIYTEAEAERAIGISNQFQALLQEQLEEEGNADRLTNLLTMAHGNIVELDLALRG